jgi:hypothetical protein
LRARPSIHVGATAIGFASSGWRVERVTPFRDASSTDRESSPSIGASRRTALRARSGFSRAFTRDPSVRKRLSHSFGPKAHFASRSADRLDARHSNRTAIAVSRAEPDTAVGMLRSAWTRACALCVMRRRLIRKAADISQIAGGAPGSSTSTASIHSWLMSCARPTARMPSRACSRQPDREERGGYLPQGSTRRLA